MILSKIFGNLTYKEWDDILGIAVLSLLFGGFIGSIIGVVFESWIIFTITSVIAILGVSCLASYFWDKSFKSTIVLVFIVLLGGVVIGLINKLLPLWIIGFILFLIMEAFFWIDNSKPYKKDNKFWYTIKKKAENLFEAILILGLSFYVIYIVENINRVNIPWASVLKVSGYVFLGIIGIGLIAGLFWLYIKLNSLKYGGKK